jgi:NitT/TauT family transport system ATP-binding protein
LSGKTISLAEVRHYFEGHRPGAAPVEVLRSTSTRVPSEQFVALLGPSGCGKTTVLNMVAGLIRPTTGKVTLDDRDPRLGDSDVGYLLARDALLPWRTALDNVALPLQVRGVGRRERERLATQVLDEVGLGNFLEAFPSQLSHGMRQRVAVARTLVVEPSTLLMDEPFSALDAQTRLGLQQKFLQLWERVRCTVMFVTHDLTEAILLADRVVVFSARPGEIRADFPVELERPRTLVDLQGSEQFHRLFRRIWDVFREEVKVYEAAQP